MSARIEIERCGLGTIMVLISQRATWPLFWCLSAETQALLMKYQFDKYGFRLVIPPRPSDTHSDTAIESPEEIDRLIRQRPHYKGKVWSGG